jgi:hypothetical protein
MKRMRRLLLLLAVTLTAPTLRGQALKSFTGDATKFPLDMKSMIAEANKNQSDEVLEPFMKAWKEGRFSADQQEHIYSTANAMLKKRMRPFPDFSNYLVTLASLANSNQPAESFTAWQRSVDRLLKLPSKNFASYISVCSSLFSSNTLYESASTRWYADNSNYSFDFDSLPKIVFGPMTLRCGSKGDSSEIFNTQGTYYPNTHLFYGQGGRVNWRRAGFDENTVYADLRNFVIDVTGSDFIADSVIFTDRTFLKEPLTGRYTDKLIAAAKPETALYPKFESYTAAIEIKNILPDVHYQGGFSLSGSKIIGSGNEEQNATIYFMRNGKLFLKAASRGFVIRPERIISENAEVTFYFENDSIYHPGLELKYMVKDRELSLFRGNQGKSLSPYFDSFHQVDIYIDELRWKIDDPQMNMKMVVGAGESQAVLESSNMFNYDRFLKIQAVSDVNPLYTIKQYAEKHDTRVIYTEDLAKSMRFAPSEVRNMLISLSNLGFLTYESEEDRATIKDRLYYYLSANTGKTDFDVIRFQSVIREKPNVSLNLLNFEMTIRGVSRIALSDSQNVFIFPQDQEIKLKKNRDFTFAGQVKAGRFDFFGKEFAFDYDRFKINLQNIDSLRLKVEKEPLEYDVYGNPLLTNVRSVLENITGDLIIDSLNNKSGKKSYPQFPVFNSKKDSYVYYDKPFIQQGVYDRNNFYFHLDPFSIDSLDNFSKAGLYFSGEFVSAGIFPDFTDTLKLQPDLSLGLVRRTSPEGWPAYGGKGKFTDTLSLSNAGLHGSGSLEYLASLSHSDDYLFLPDSMNTIVRDFSNRKGLFDNVEFPQAGVGRAAVQWLPKQDVMSIAKLDEPIRMYDGQASVTSGALELRPPGMTGWGIVALTQSELESKKFAFRQDAFGADTADFRLNTADSLALAFASKNVKAHIDLLQRIGDFKSNGSGSYVTFPYNEYICYIDQFKWYMDKHEIELTSSSTAQAQHDNDLGLSGSEFISIASGQDSLRFRAPYARYSLNDYLIKAEQVALIRTADAAVTPDSGKVVIEKKARMQTLYNARILANTTTKYHDIFNATVNILGRKKYEGSGDYNYVDENQTKELIHLYAIGVDTSGQTVATGGLTDSAGFALSPQFLFKGDVKLAAASEFLTFSGYAMPNFRCDLVEKNWIRFSRAIDPVNIRIPVSNPVTDNGGSLAATIALSNDSTGIYSAFLMPKHRPSDRDLLAATGVLTYDKSSGEFRIASEEKLEKPVLPGNYLSLDDKSCTVYGEGAVSLPSEFGQLKLQTAGNLTNNMNNGATTFDVIAAVDFPFSEDAMKVLSQFLENEGTLKPTQDIGHKAFERGIAEWMGREKADKLIADLNLYGSLKKMPDEMRHTLVISELQLGWENETGTIRSSGPLGISSMDKNSINKRVNGVLEIQRKRSGDLLTIYLEPIKGTWFFFSYSRGLMQAISSVTAFNEEITKLKDDKRKVKGDKGVEDYEFMLSTDRAVKNFLRKLQPEPEEK